MKHVISIFYLLCSILCYGSVIAKPAARPDMVAVAIPAAVALPSPPVRTWLPPHPWGVYAWGNNLLRDQYPPEIAAEIRGFPLTWKWVDLEPEQRKYTFDKAVRAPLEEIARRGTFTHIMLHVAYDTPRWVFEKAGVPEVLVPQRISPGRREQNLSFPYYFDQRFQALLRTTVKALADYIAALPDDLKRRIVFIQMAEGSTGDAGPYKGTPLEAKYIISPGEWSQYRRNIWTYYITQFQRADGSLSIPIMVNGDSEDADGEENWLLDHCDNFGVKQGMFSHGYIVSDAIERVDRWEVFRAKALASGHRIFSRGEQDGEWTVCGWCAKNTAAAFYWTALYALHCKLDVWNVRHDALLTQPITEALRIFNRYAGYNEPETSPGAFCALRRGLNAADVVAFPEDKYGKATRSNQERYMAIAKAFAPYGALQEDPAKALGGGMRNRQADGQNDVGWNILPGNLERFLTQLRPEETSVAVWHIDESPYGMFARRFDAASGRTCMTFRLSDNFFATPGATATPATTPAPGRSTTPTAPGTSAVATTPLATAPTKPATTPAALAAPGTSAAATTPLATAPIKPAKPVKPTAHPVTLRVVWLDKGRGEWELVYATASGEKVARRVVDTDSGLWRDLTLTLNDCLWDHRLAGGGDLALRYVGGGDTTFHIIELARK